MYAIKVTAAKLAELRMLADWQLRGMGIDPASVTAAYIDPVAGDRYYVMAVAPAGYRVVDGTTGERVWCLATLSAVWLTEADATEHARRLNGLAYDETASNPAGQARQYGPEIR